MKPTNHNLTSEEERETHLLLGETTWRHQYRSFGILPSDRLRHLYLLGKTGTGKSTLILSLVIQDLWAGQGLALLDPHGDLVRNVLPYVPAERTSQVLLFSPEDKEWPVSFNVFRRGKQQHPDTALLSSQLVALFRKLWADSWGPRLEHLLRNAILAVAQDQRATMVFLYRFLTDAGLRERVVQKTADPVVRQFWTKEFPSYSRQLQGEALSPVLNKLGAFVANPTVRNLIGQERSRLDFRDFMNHKGVLLANLATGRIGEDASHLLGGLLLTAIQLAALERGEGQPQFYVYADEFQHFASEATVTMLSEARKFGLGLTLAHQYFGQLPQSIQEAVIGNVGSLLVFRLGGADARLLEREFSPIFTAEELTQLPCHQVAIRLMVRGEALPAFSARTLLPPRPPPEAEMTVIRIREQSRLRYSRPCPEVEAAINRMLDSTQ